VHRNQAISALAAGYVPAQAFRHDATGLLEALHSHDGSPVPLAGLVFAVCEAFAGPLAGWTRDLREGSANDIPLVPSLLLRLYEQAELTGRKDLQNRCLDIWENMLQARVGGSRELMRSIDRDG
jgi:hypothetical protein